MNVVYSLGYTEWDVKVRSDQYVEGRGTTSLSGSSITYWLSYTIYHGNDFMTVGAIFNGTVVMRDVP